jgi:hypothetical protein
MNHTHHSRNDVPPLERRRDWRRIHHSPLFWVGVLLFLLAMTIYLSTEDLSWVPFVRR